VAVASSSRHRPDRERYWSTVPRGRLMTSAFCHLQSAHADVGLRGDGVCLLSASPCLFSRLMDRGYFAAAAYFPDALACRVQG
jgi:hypothetical protein